MEEKIEKLLKMMEELQKMQNNEREENLHRRNSRLRSNEGKRNENLARIEELQNSKSIIVENNVRLENMRAPFNEDEEQYTELTVEIDGNNAKIVRIDSEIADLNNGIEALHNEDKEIKKEALISDKPEKRAEMEDLKQEIINDLTNIQRDIVSSRNVPTQEVKSLQVQNAQLKAEVDSRNEGIKQKEAEVEKIKEADKEEIARLEAENKKITEKIELAEKYVEMKDESFKLLEEIKELRTKIKIEEITAARIGYAGELERVKELLKEKEEKFSSNPKAMEKIKQTLLLRNTEGIKRFIQRNKNKFAKNLATIKANKPNEKIGTLNKEISSMRAENKKAEQTIGENSSKADAIKSYLHEDSENGYGIISSIPALIEAVKGIDTTFEYDTKLDMDRLNSIKASIHNVETNSACLESNRKGIHKDNDSLSQEDVDKIVAKAKIQRLAEAKTGAKAKFSDYLAAKGVEKEKVITIYDIMNKYIHNETDIVRIETLSNFDEFIKGRMQRVAERIEELKRKDKLEIIETKRIAFLEKTLKEMNKECEVLGIEKIEIKPTVEKEDKSQESTNPNKQQQQTQLTASNNQTAQNTQGANNTQAPTGQRPTVTQAPNTAPQGEAGASTTASVVEELEKEDKSIDKIVIGNGIEIFIYDNEARMHTIRKIPFRKMSGILKLSEKDKVAMINEMTGEIVGDDIKNMMKDMDPSVIYSLSVCVKKYGISTEEASRNLEMYIDALNGVEEAKDMMSEVLEYNKISKVFAKKVCDKIKGFANKAKQLGMAKVKEEKTGILSRIFKKKAIPETTVTEPAHEETSFAQRMADEDATRRTNEVSAKAEEQGVQEAEQQVEQEEEVL